MCQAQPHGSLKNKACCLMSLLIFQNNFLNIVVVVNLVFNHGLPFWIYIYIYGICKNKKKKRYLSMNIWRSRYMSTRESNFLHLVSLHIDLFFHKIDVISTLYA